MERQVELPPDFSIIHRDGKNFLLIDSESEASGQFSIPDPPPPELEILSQDRVRWGAITCHLSESQMIAMQSILDGDGSFAMLGELISGDECTDKKSFYNLAASLRRKFKATGIPYEVRPVNQRLALLRTPKV